jgi:hypothetical protein
VCAELREERLRPFEDHSQRIWEELRRQSNVDLRPVRLPGSEKATVRKLVMEVSVDGTEARRARLRRHPCTSAPR